MTRALCLGLIALAACGGDAENSGRTVFIGTLGSSDALVSAVERDGAFSLFACGGATTFETHTVWFDGTLTDNRTTSTVNGFTLDARRDGNRFVGTLTLASGTSFDLDLAQAADGTSSGPFRTEDTCRIGAIVRQDAPGATPFVQGVGCDEGGFPAQVTPVSPVMVGADGLAVEVVRSGQPQRFLLQAVLP